MRREAIAVLAASLLWTPVRTPAQEASPERGSLFQFHGPEEVRLRWNAPRQTPYLGFHLERRSAEGGGWERITDRPVERVADVARIRELLGPSAEAFLTFFPGDSVLDQRAFARVMGDPVARDLIGLLSVKLPELGRVLGELHGDRDLRPGEAFVYRVLVVRPDESEAVWATGSEPVEHGNPTSVPVPEGLAGEGGDATALLDWEHDRSLSRSGRLVGYRVYRAPEPYGPYRPATIETIVPAAVQGELPDFLFVDRHLPNGVPHWYRITGVNVVGVESAPSDTVRVVPRDRRPPPPPTQLEGATVGQSVVLRWSPVEAEDLAGYAVFRSRDFEGPYERVAPADGQLPSTSFVYVDESVTEGSIYWYRVASLDRSENRSRFAETVQVFLEDGTPPTAPEGLVAVGTEDGVRLTWSANAEADLQGYRIQRTTRLGSARSADDGERPPGPFFGLHASPLTDTVYVDSVPRTSQTRYGYRVIAIDEAWNESPGSDVVTARMPDAVPPGPPALEAVRLEEDRIVLEWGRSTEEDLAGYRVYRAHADTAEFVSPHGELLPADSTDFADVPPRPGERYLYRLTAIDSSGNESESLDPTTVLYMDVVPPNPPTGLALASVGEGLRLTWSSAGGPDVRTVVVLRRSGEEGPLRERDRMPAEKAGYVDVRVSKGSEYTFALRAVDGAGNASEPSEAVTAAFEPPSEEEAEAEARGEPAAEEASQKGPPDGG